MYEQAFTINGVTFATLPALSFGHYGGAGSIGRANINCILEDKSLKIDPISYGLVTDIQECNARGKDSVADIVALLYGADKYFGDGPYSAPDAVHAQGSYGSETVWLRLDDNGNNETLDALCDYPVIDDEAVSAVESQWEEDAFDSWLESDLIRALSDSLQDTLYDIPNDKRMDLTWTAYRAAMEECNEYPVPEYDGIYVDVDRISDAFARHVSEALK